MRGVASRTVRCVAVRNSVVLFLSKTSPGMAGAPPGGGAPAVLRTDLALVPDVEADRRQQGQALDDLLPVAADAEEVHAVVQHTEDETADDRAEDGADTAAHGGATDERRGDGLEFEVQARLR